MKRITLANTLKVGFNGGSQEYPLAFITYINDNGKQSSEHSFNNWIDTNAATVELESKPFSGFTFDISKVRRNYYYFGGSEYVRIYDLTNKWQFEISLQNLLLIINTNDVVNQEFTGQYVYAFDIRGKVVLLPVNSADYEDAVNYTEVKKVKSIKTDKMVVGNVYKNKMQERFVYLGEFSPIPTRCFMYEYHFSKYCVFFDLQTNKYETNKINSLIEDCGSYENKHELMQQVNDFFEVPIEISYIEISKDVLEDFDKKDEISFHANEFSTRNSYIRNFGFLEPKKFKNRQAITQQTFQYPVVKYANRTMTLYDFYEWTLNFSDYHKDKLDVFRELDEFLCKKFNIEK